MTTNLLRLYQQDAQASVPALTMPAARVTDWIDLVKDYAEQIGVRYARAADISNGEKKVAANCLNLAVQALQAGASAAGALETAAAPTLYPKAATPSGKDTVLAVIMVCLGIFNLWLENVPGVISILALLVLFAHFHRADISVLNGVFPWQRGGGTGSGASKVVAKGPAAMDIRSTVEAILRRSDDIVAYAGQRPEAPPPTGLQQSTLEFFQDILEAKLSDDRDFAFKKITRTLGTVLAAEGIDIAMDAEAHQAMFRFDTVVDANRANQFQTIRPALTRNAKCLLPGYARHFIAA
jgi:hypothetical protein